MDPGKPRSKSRSKSQILKSKKLVISSKEEDKLKSFVVINPKPSCIGSNSAYCVEINNSSKTLPTQSERFGVYTKDIFNVNYRSETSAMAAETWYKKQPPISQDSFFADRDFFTGLTIPNSLTKPLQTLCHALQIQYNHTLPYNTAAMYGVSLNNQNINRYFEGVIGVMPTFKYGNISFGDFDFVILKPRLFIPPNDWNICSIPLGPRTKMKEDRKDSNLYRLQDFLPLFSNQDANTMKRSLLEKIARARELQMKKITEQLSELINDKSNKNKRYITLISDIIKLWKADIKRFSTSYVADEIISDKSVNALRKIMCEITLDRIEPLLAEDGINFQKFNALKTAVEKMDNSTTSNTKITIPYVDSRTNESKEKQVEIKDVDIEITQPSRLKSMAIVCNEVLLIGPNSRFNEAISAVYGNRRSEHPYHLYPGNSYIDKPVKSHKPLLIGIDYKDIDEEHLLDVLVDEIEKAIFPVKERMRESFFSKLLEKGLVYKVEENGDKLIIQNIPKASMKAFGDMAFASRSLMKLDPDNNSAYRAERDKVSVFEPQAQRAISYASGEIHTSPVQRQSRVFNKPMKNTEVPNFWRPKLIASDPIRGEEDIYRKMQVDIGNQKQQVIINSVRDDKKRSRVISPNSSQKRGKKSKSMSPSKGGNYKTRKNRR